jgi:hypothetical protein
MASSTLLFEDIPGRVRGAATSSDVEHDLAADRPASLRSLGMLAAAPLLGLLLVVLLPAIVVGAVLVVATRAAFAAEPPDSSGTGSRQPGARGPVAGDARPADLLGASAHKFLPCASCHSAGASDASVPASKADRRMSVPAMTARCRSCHGGEQLAAKAHHRQVIERADARTCWSCHGTHGIQRVWRLKSTKDDNEYCTLCHDAQRPADPDTTRAGEADGEVAAVHAGAARRPSHACTNCHPSVTKDEHPSGPPTDSRAMAVSVSNTCRTCHADKYQQYRGSVHSKMTERGHTGTPVCTDCHGAHASGPSAVFETVSGVPCKKCHEAVFSIYRTSVHGEAKSAGKSSAPQCSGCHFAHQIKPALSSRTAKAPCTGCHRDALRAHKKWLPNVKAHFDAVACTACHVAEAERNVLVRIADDSSGELFTDQRLRQVLGASYERLLDDEGGRGIDGTKLLAMHRKLAADPSARAHLVASLNVSDTKKAHAVSTKKAAVKQCDACHTAGSGFMQRVSVVVHASDGSKRYRAVDPGVLGSVAAALPLGRFYAIGGTRLRALDLGGLLVAVGGLLGCALHAAARMVAAARRSLGPRLRMGGAS